MATDFPAVGSGFGTFAVAYPLYRSPEIRLFYRHTHNDVLAPCVWIAGTEWITDPYLIAAEPEGRYVVTRGLRTTLGDQSFASALTFEILDVPRSIDGRELRRLGIPVAALAARSEPLPDIAPRQWSGFWLRPQSAHPTRTAKTATADPRPHQADWQSCSRAVTRADR